MAKNLHRVEQECAGLTTALNKFKKGSREWALIKLKLDIVMDELACIMEDYAIFENVAGVKKLHNANDDDAYASSQDDAAGMIPISVSAKLTDSVRTIPVVPLRKPEHLVTDACLVVGKMSSRSRHHGACPIDGRYNNDQQMMDLKDLTIILEGVQKYSAEWFTIKSVMNELSQGKEHEITKIRVETLLDEASQKISKSYVLRDDDRNKLLSRVRQNYRIRQHEQEQQQRQAQRQIHFSTVDNQTSGESGTQAPGQAPVCPEETTMAMVQQKAASDRCLALDEVPKYSLEWFQIKKGIASDKHMSKDTGGGEHFRPVPFVLLKPNNMPRSHHPVSGKSKKGQDLTQTIAHPDDSIENQTQTVNAWKQPISADRYLALPK